MSRRFQTLALVCLCGSLGGCEPWHRQHTRSKDEQPPIFIEGPIEDTSKQHPEEQELRNFFKPTRTSGAWSSEAREIERSLGAIP